MIEYQPTRSEIHVSFHLCNHLFIVLKDIRKSSVDRPGVCMIERNGVEHDRNIVAFADDSENRPGFGD